MISKALRKELFLYGVVGALGVAIDSVFFALLLHFGYSLILAQWVGAIIGSTHNFVWHYAVVFSHNQTLGKTYVYSMILTVVIVLLSGPMIVYANQFFPSVWISKAAVILLTAALSYILRKVYIFRLTSAT
jgi:putative flippase GtrA